MEIALYLSAAYILVGIVITSLTYEREQGGWLVTIILWPLAILAMIGVLG